MAGTTSIHSAKQTSIGPEIYCESATVHFVDPTTTIPRAVVDQLEMHVPAGSVVALLGQSGCGKSTLLRSVAGLQRIHSGSILIGKKSIEEARDSLAFVFQEPALLPWRTAIENVCLPLEIQKHFGREEMRNRAKVLLKSVGFSIGDCDKLPSQLSGGMKMRVSIARALVNEPNLLLLDEPFAALDDMLRWRMNEMLLAIQQQDSKTILFVTHNIAEAIFLSHQIAIMKKGRIATWIENPLLQPRTTELRSTNEFAQFYGIISRVLSEAAH